MTREVGKLIRDSRAEIDLCAQICQFTAENGPTELADEEDDAGRDTAVDACVTARIYNNGETCVNGKRFIVTEKNYDAFVERYTETFAAIVMGDPTDESTGLGPIARVNLRDTLHSQVQESVEMGARILTGGEVPDREGAWYPATLLVDVKPGATGL